MLGCGSARAAHSNAVNVVDVVRGGGRPTTLQRHSAQATRANGHPPPPPTTALLVLVPSVGQIGCCGTLWRERFPQPRSTTTSARRKNNKILAPVSVSESKTRAAYYEPATTTAALPPLPNLLNKVAAAAARCGYCCDLDHRCCPTGADGEPVAVVAAGQPMRMSFRTHA